MSTNDQEKSNKKEFFERQEKFNLLAESDGMKELLENDLEYTAPVPDKMKGKTAFLVENMLENMDDVLLGENFATTTDGTFFKDKMPALYRETASHSEIFDWVSYQPISSPKSQVFAIRTYYAGRGVADATTARSLLTSQDRGENTDAAFRSFVILIDASTAQYNAITEGTSYIKASGGAGNNIAKVLYKEIADTGGAKLLVELEDGEDMLAIGDIYVTGPNADIAMSHLWDNEMGRRMILSNYAGPYTTSEGEALTANEVRVSLESIDVKAESYYLNFTISSEFIEDFRATTGTSAIKEFNTAIGWQLAMAKNRKIWNLLTSSAEYSTSWNYDDVQSRMEADKIISFRNKCNYEKNRIAEKSNVGIGNQMAVTTKVFSMIESSGTYQDTSNGTGQAGFVRMGKWNNCDIYLNTLDAYTEDYVLLAHKSGDINAGVGWSEYIPLQVASASDRVQPHIKTFSFRTRAAAFKNPMGSSRFLTYFSVNFGANSSWK